MADVVQLHPDALDADEVEQAEEMQALADAVAQDALDNLFHSWRGFYSATADSAVERDTLLCIYDNYPFEGHPEVRDQMFDQLVAWCEEHDVPVLGRGTAGDDDYPEYTRSLILGARDAGSKRVVVAAWQVILDRAVERLDRSASSGGPALRGAP
jgi:hypothetical protein